MSFSPGPLLLLWLFETLFILFVLQLLMLKLTGFIQIGHEHLFLKLLICTSLVKRGIAIKVGFRSPFTSSFCRALETV